MQMSSDLSANGEDVFYLCLRLCREYYAYHKSSWSEWNLYSKQMELKLISLASRIAQQGNWWKWHSKSSKQMTEEEITKGVTHLKCCLRRKTPQRETADTLERQYKETDEERHMKEWRGWIGFKWNRIERNEKLLQESCNDTAEEG